MLRSNKLVLLIFVALSVMLLQSSVLAQPTEDFVNTAIEPQTGVFVATFNATATVDSVDGVLGLSEVEPTGYGDFKCKILFNNAGFITASNGASFEAETVLAYEAGINYAVKQLVNILDQTYSVWVTPDGGEKVTIGENFAFTEGVVDSLNWRSVKMGFGFPWGGNEGMVEVTDFTTSYSEDFVNTPIETQTSAFVAEFNATATADSVDGVIGLSKEWPDSYGAYSIKVLFNNEGFITASNGNAFEADSAFAYAAGTTYAIKIVGNILEQDFSIWVQNGEDDPVLIGENFAFDPDPGVVDSLNYRSVKMSFHPQWGGNEGIVEITDFTIGYPDGANINTPFEPQAGRFMFEFNALPTADLLDGVLGFTKDKPGNKWDYGQPVKLLFNNSGLFTARNAGDFEAVNDFAYSAGTTYAIRMVVDIPMQTYDAWIAPAGGNEVVIAKDFALDGAADTLQWRTIIMSHSGLPWGGSYGFVEITNFTISDAPIEMLSVAFIGRWPGGEPSPDDSLLIDHLSQTYDVTLVADDTIMAGLFTKEDLAGFDFGFVSESASTWRLESAPENFYKIAPVPMFYTENYASKSTVAGWVSAEGFFGTIYDTLGQADGQTVLIMDDTGHPLSAGFDFGSEVDIVSGPGDEAGRTLTYCIPEIEYIPIAVWKGDPELSIVHGVEAGTVLWDALGLDTPDTLVSEYRAAAVGVFAAANKNITADGFALIDAGIAWILDDGATAIDDLEVATVSKFELSQNYPNPFNPTTEISFTLAKPGHTTLTVYNVIGQVVKTLVNNEMAQGRHQITFDAHNLASGVYFYQIQSSDFTQIKKMVLMK